MQSVLDNSRDVIVSYDIEKQGYEFVSSSVIHLIGYTPEECTAMDREQVMGMLHPDDRQAFKRAELEADRSGVSEVEYRQKARDGHWVWVSNRMSVSRDGRGRPVRRISNIRDITERKRADEELRGAIEEKEKNAAEISLERKRLMDLLETMPSMVCLLTPDHQVAFANRAFRDMFGEARGRRCYEYRFGFDKPCGFCEAFEPLKTGKSHRWMFSTNGDTTVTAHNFPFTDSDGSPMILEVDIDITERVRVEKRRARDLDALTRMHSLTSRTLETSDFDGALKGIMDTAVAIMEAEKGTFQILEGQTLRIAAQHGHLPDFLEFFAAAEKVPSVAGQAMRLVERVIVPDVEESPLLAGTESLGVLRRAGVRAVVSTPVTSHDGELLGMLTVQWGSSYNPPQEDLSRLDVLVRLASDLIERKKVETEFSYLATFPQLNPNPITEVDPDGNVVYANPVAQRVFPDLEERGRLHPYLVGWARVMARLDSEVRLTRDIQVGDSWYDQAVYRLPSSQNVRIYGRDITSRKRVESYLRDALQRIDAHFANSPLAVIEFDPEYRVIRWSGGAERLFGWAAAEVLGKSVNDFRLVVEDDSQMVDSASTGMFSGQNQRNLTVNRNYLKDGSIITCEWYNSALYDEQGKMVSVLSQVLDISERIKTDQIKDEFIGMVSHELKTPLTVVTGAIKVATTENLPEAEKQALLADAAWGAETMADIVDNLLELSRWQSHRLVLIPALVDIGAVIEKVVRDSSKKSSRHRIIASVSPRLPEVNADGHRVERILENLVDNAIKYSPDGGKVTVSARLQNGAVMVSVADAGIGIAKKDMDRLFQPFGRLETRVAGSAVQGVGLGLVVCRRLVEAHGGRIWVESLPGKGSTFFFTLPRGSQG